MTLSYSPLCKSSIKSICFLFIFNTLLSEIYRILACSTLSFAFVFYSKFSCSHSYISYYSYFFFKIKSLIISGLRYVTDCLIAFPFLFPTDLLLSSFSTFGGLCPCCYLFCVFYFYIKKSIK